MEITWESIQTNSDKILSDGVYQLLNAEIVNPSKITYNCFGNYLISHKSYHVYIGETGNVKKRLNDHVKGKTKFYKNYVKFTEKSPDSLPANIDIVDFDCRFLKTFIGRKEIEEFGIVNIPTPLNKTMKRKRGSYSIELYNNFWKNVQEQVDTLLEQGEQAFLDFPLIHWKQVQSLPQPYIYWIEHSEFGLVYIGETGDFKDRFVDKHSKYTGGSAFRKNVGEIIYCMKLHKYKEWKKPRFQAHEETQINNFINDCVIRFMPVQFGRFELEEYLIDKYQPLLNRKGKRKKPL